MESLTWFQTIIYVIVLYYSHQLLYFIGKIIYSFVLPKFGFVCDLRRYGDWAVVTGSTDGIGKEYAFQLADRGFSIVLISRSKEKLIKVADEIESKYNVKTKIIVYDFSRIDGYEMIRDEVRDLDVGILVNNVGTTYGRHPVDHHTCDLQRTFDVMHTNIFSDVAMTKFIMEGMVARKRGLIIHVSSLTTKLEAPRMNVYSSTKSFMEKFVPCLRYENPLIIDHQVVIPGFVSTNMSGVKQSWSSPSAKDYVTSALGTAGLVNVTNGYWYHELFSALLPYIPSHILAATIDKRRKKIMEDEMNSKLN